MPDTVTFPYWAQWAQDGTSDIERGISGINGVIGGTQDLSSTAGGLLGNIENRLVAMGNSTGFRRLLRDRGAAFNANKEMFYDGPSFRAFPMQWQISFETQEEVRVFDEMHGMLLEHMHPEFRDGRESGLWEMPDSFLISFEGTKLRKIKECVLTSCSVDYTASGAGWKAFTNGSAAHVNLSLSFSEITPLTREDIREGY